MMYKVFTSILLCVFLFYLSNVMSAPTSAIQNPCSPDTFDSNNMCQQRPDVIVDHIIMFVNCKKGYSSVNGKCRKSVQTQRD